MLKQSKPVVPPVPTDRTLGNFSSIVQNNLADLHQAAHVHKIVKAPPAANDGNIGDIYVVSTPTSTYLTVKDANGWTSQSNDITNVKNFGALGDDHTNDLMAFQDAAATDHFVFVPDATYLLTNDLILKSPELGLYGVPNGSILDGSFAIDLSSNTTIKDLTLKKAQFVTSVSNPTNIVLDNITVYDAVRFAAVDFEGAGLSDITVRNSSIDGSATAVLVNGNSGGKRFRLVNSLIIGDTADAAGINEPGVIFKDFIVMGNFMASHGATIIATGGSAFSNAAAENGVIIGNVIEDASSEGLHFEDAQKNNVVVGNVINTRHMGITAYYSVLGGIQNDAPLTIGFNQITQDPLSAHLYNGIFLQSGPDGTLPGSPIIGNHINGFSEGIFLGAVGATQKAAIQVVDGNSIEDCSFALAASGSAGTGEMRQIGTNYANNCPTLFTTSAHYSFGKIISASKPTTILAGPGGGYAGFMPSSFDGVAYPPDNYTTNGAGTPETIWSVFPAGANQRFLGRIRVRTRFTGTTTWCYTSATLKWDGATLTISDQISRTGTVLSVPTFAVSGGNLNFVITSSAAATLNANYIEFDGEYWDS